MGAIGSLFSGDQGSGWKAKAAPVVMQDNLPADISSAQSKSGAINDQQLRFLRALQQQGGLSNQKSVFNQQQQTANQLAIAAAGGGPNPAQAQYQKNINEAAATAAGTVASQKGINPALAARLAAKAQAEAGQNAAADAATLQAQQQIAARTALQQQQATMANEAAGEVANEAQQGQNIAQNEQNQQQILQNALASENNAIVGSTSSENNANSAIQQQNAKFQSGMLGGALGAAGSVFGFAEGGEVSTGPTVKPGIMPKIGQAIGDLGKAGSGNQTSGGVESAGYQGGKGFTEGLPTVKPGIMPKIGQAIGDLGKAGSGNQTSGGVESAGYQGGKGFTEGLMKLAKSLYSSPSGSSPQTLQQYQDAFNNAANAEPSTTLPASTDMDGIELGEADAGTSIADAGSMAGDAAADAADIAGAAEVGADAAEGLGALGDIAMIANKGGRVRKMATGGSTDDNPMAGMSGIMKLVPLAIALLNKGGKLPASHAARYMKGYHPKFQHGGKVKAMVSPGEEYLSPKKVRQVEKGANPLKVGERIPGKAKVKGDSPKNDTVRKNLQEGGVVIPRSKAKNPRDAAAFVRAVEAKKAAKRS